MAETIRHIVVGYDGSESSRIALRRACELAQPDGAVSVVHVYDVPWQAEIYPWLEEFKGICKEVAEEVLKSARGICDQYLVKSNFKTAVGKPANVLAELAESESADFIVVGTRGPGPVRAALGSVTYRLLHRTHRPVLVVPDPIPLDKELGALDGANTEPQLLSS